MLKNKIRIDLYKNSKLPYYIVNIFRLFIPSFFYTRKLNSLLKNSLNDEYIQKRVNYYNKVENEFHIDENTSSIDSFSRDEKKKTYYFDLLESLRYFNKKFKISYLFGDITYIPEKPSIVKSRPINCDNKNSILLKLNKVRHFIFVHDNKAFEDKKNILVWRGKCYTDKRQKFIQAFYNAQNCNIGQTNPNENPAWQKSKMQLKEQLDYKFILAIEGNDVASNLKWIMSSNSIAFMVKPTFETWFMEGTLIANYHYVLLKDDYSDLNQQIEYYSKNIHKSLEIIKNANKYTKQFQNKKRETIISLFVLKKYFKQSQQTSVKKHTRD